MICFLWLELVPFVAVGLFQQPEKVPTATPEFVIRLKGPVRSVLYNPIRGEIICATGAGLTAISPKSKRITWAVDHETHAYEPVAICPKKEEMATTGMNGITFWSLATYERRSIINSDTKYSYCYYTADNNLLVGHSFQGAQVLDRKKPEETVIQRFPVGYSGTYVSPNGVAAFLSSSVLDPRAGEPGRIKIWDIGRENARSDVLIPQCKYEIRCLAASDDGQLLFVGDEGGNSVLMDTKTYKITTLSPAKYSIDRAAFSRKADLVAYGDHWGGILVWDIENARIIDRIGYHRESILGLAVVGDRSECLIASGDRKGRVAFWKREFR